MLLDKGQIKKIELDVESARLTIMQLSQELVDHICCEVEYLMAEGKTFDEAYALIKKEAGIETLQGIQENTLYLIDKNYALMKTIMKITGNIALALLAFGTTFKIFHWPGAGVMLVIGFGLLSLLFFPSAIYLNYKEGQSKGKTGLYLALLLGGISLIIGVLFKVMHWPGAAPLLTTGWGLILFLFLPAIMFEKLKKAERGERKIYITGFIGVFLFEMATLFKIMHWPGASILLITGSIVLVSVFLPLYSIARLKTRENKTGEFIYLITLSIYAVVLTALMSINVSRDALSGFTRSESNSTRISSYFMKKKTRNESPRDIVQFKTGQYKFTIEAEKTDSVIASIKEILIKSIESTDDQTVYGMIQFPNRIQKKDNFDFVNRIMLYPEDHNLATILRIQIETFKNSALESVKENPFLTEQINLLLSTDTNPAMKEDAPNQTWESQRFQDNMLISTMSFLSTTQKNVRFIEAAVVNELNK